jgi:hypothetical protein
MARVSTEACVPDPPEDVEWEMPGPLGRPESIQTAGGVAAPLLAGFSLTIATVLLPSISDAKRTFGRWGDLTLGLLLAAAILLVMAVQCAMTARGFQVTPDELLTWWGRPAGPPSAAMLANQKEHARKNKRWASHTRWTYNLGILLLLAALPLTILPPGDIPTGRWVVASVAAAGFLVEVVWVGATLIRSLATALS